MEEKDYYQEPSNFSQTPEELAILEQMRQKLANNFGVTVQNDFDPDSFVTLRFYREGRLVHVCMKVVDITLSPDDKDKRR